MSALERRAFLIHKTFLFLMWQVLL